MNLEDIPGIGPSLAPRIKKILAGRDIYKNYKDSDIYELLPTQSRAYLKYRPIDHVPRRALCDIVRRIEGISVNMPCIIAGSWRRGIEYCNDLDILMSRELFNSGGLQQLTRVAHLIAPFANGDEIIRTYARLRPRVYIAVDIFIYDDLAPYLLYATGDREFNKYMRGIAKRQGYTLNQHGLYRISKNSEPIKIMARDEAEIFEHLQMTYIEPCDRKKNDSDNN